ncbi:MAG: LuxR C-terminal-related transcriptional regulator [Bacteroidota bacterium]
MLINQKLTPLFLTQDGKIWKGLCIVSLSGASHSGNVKIIKSGSNTIFTYDLENNCWRSDEKIELSAREVEILRLSVRGFTISEIAEQIFLSIDTIKFHRRNIFKKLEVSNISEAISSAVNNKLI